jgi:hypothetical protein
LFSGLLPGPNQVGTFELNSASRPIRQLEPATGGTYLPSNKLNAAAAMIPTISQDNNHRLFAPLPRTRCADPNPYPRFPPPTFRAYQSKRTDPKISLLAAKHRTVEIPRLTVAPKSSSHLYTRSTSTSASRIPIIIHYHLNTIHLVLALALNLLPPRKTNIMIMIA